MAAWTAADVIILAPEFKSVAIPLIDRYILMAEQEVGANWGTRAKYAGVLLTAHLMTVMGANAAAGGAGGAASGPINSVHVGEVSVGYGSLSASAGNIGSLALSKYGQEYQRLVRLMGYGVAVV